MSESTGFENVTALQAQVAADEVKLAADKAALAAMAGEAAPAAPAAPVTPPPPNLPNTPPAEPLPWHHGMTPEQRNAAELAESARQAALHAAAPVPPVDELQPADGQMSEAAKLNKQLFDRIQAARNQPVPPPPPPQPVAPAIVAQTQREMAEGKRIAQRHADQQATAVRRTPTASEVAAQGSTTPVFVPGDFVPKP